MQVDEILKMVLILGSVHSFWHGNSWNWIQSKRREDDDVEMSMNMDAKNEPRFFASHITS